MKQIIAIGDLHGHLPALEGILQALKNRLSIFSNQNLRLHEGIELVFLGDYIDRGADSRGVINVISQIQAINPDQVTCLLGNHELLAIAGLDEINKILEFAPNEPFDAYCEDTLHGQNGGGPFVANFGATEKEALLNYKAELSKSGKIGKWLRGLKPFCVKSIGQHKILFVHAGLPKHIVTMSDLEASGAEAVGFINSSNLGCLSYHIDSPHVGEDSIFWDRNFIARPDEVIQARAKQLGVNRIVVGHTPKKEITTYGKTVFNIDVGMSPRYGANDPAAIVFEANTPIMGCYRDKGLVELAAIS